MTDTIHAGSYEVRLLLDGEFEAPAEVLIHEAGETARRKAIAALGTERLRLDVNCFLLRGPSGLTLVDSGAGTAWGPGFGHARSLLDATGVEPAHIDRVLLTHLHSDHSLGLLDGDVPTLPRAAILVPAADLAYFSDPAAHDAAPETGRGHFDITRRLQQAYGERLRGIADGDVLPGIEAVPLHGHSPGHTGYLLHDHGTALLLWGDTLHVGALQPADPGIGMAFDIDPAAAAATRRATLARAAAAGWIVAGGHVTGFVRVKRDGDAYQLVPASG